MAATMNIPLPQMPGSASVLGQPGSSSARGQDVEREEEDSVIDNENYWTKENLWSSWSLTPQWKVTRRGKPVKLSTRFWLCTSQSWSMRKRSITLWLTSPNLISQLCTPQSQMMRSRDWSSRLRRAPFWGLVQSPGPDIEPGRATHLFMVRLT